MTTDRELLDALADLVNRIDPTPETLAAQAQAALAERIDATPLGLITDSAHGMAEGVRGGGATRTLRFTDLDLRLDTVANRVHATGLARVGTCAVARWPGGAREVEIEPTGWFHIDRIPFGPVKFVLRHGNLPDRATHWFVA